MASVDDEFGDEYFDDLLGEDLEELERKAILSTQAPTTTSAGVVTGTIHAEYTQQVGHGGVSYGADFGDADDEVVNAVAPEYGQVLTGGSNTLYRQASRVLERNAEANTTESLGKSRNTGLRRTPSNLPYRPSSQAYGSPYHGEGASQGEARAAVRSNENASANLDDLQARVQELLLEREKLQQAFQDANRQIFTKSGEIAVVRANNERLVREREQKISDLERELKAANERHGSEIEQAKRQQDQLATENRFADHDRVIEKARQRRQVQRPEQDVIVTKTKQKAAAAESTPRKSRQRILGTGFGAQERSPIRSPSLQSRSATPSAAEKKRKRTTDNHPRLDVGTDDGNRDHSLMYHDEDLDHSIPHHLEPVQGQQPDERYGILQNFLNHRIEWGQERTIEALSKFRFPSDDKTTLSSLIYDGVAKLTDMQDQDDYATALGSLVISLWEKCLSEKFYEPLGLLIDQTFDMLAFSPNTSLSTLDELVPLIQTTGDVNIVPRFKRHRRGNSAASAASSHVESADISVADCLNLLLFIVSSIEAHDAASTQRFWMLMRFDFTSMLLRSSQDPVDVRLIAQLLTFSAQDESVGSIIGPERTRPSQDQTTFDQAKSEEHLIDRLTSMLIEIPRPLNSDVDKPYGDHLLCDMRLSILGTLSSFASNEHAGKVIAAHPLAIGRLVRCMSDAYHNALESAPDPDSVLRSHLDIVAEATRLVYHFVNAYKNVEINAKLGKIPGGPQKYLVVLSRLVFSEGDLYGEEIEEDVQDCAQALLEDFVSPEEGDMLMELAGSQ